MNWFGIDITEELTINHLKLLISENTIIIVLKNQEDNSTYTEFFLLLNYISSLIKQEISFVFGLFIDPNYSLIRKKLKQEKKFLNIDLQEFLSLLEGDNKDSYYTNKLVTENFLGLEIRFKQNLSLIDWDEEWINIQKFILKEKKALLKQYYNLKI